MVLCGLPFETATVPRLRVLAPSSQTSQPFACTCTFNPVLAFTCRHIQTSWLSYLPYGSVHVRYAPLKLLRHHVRPQTPVRQALRHSMTRLSMNNVPRGKGVCGLEIGHIRVGRLRNWGLKYNWDENKTEEDAPPLFCLTPLYTNKSPTTNNCLPIFSNLALLNAATAFACLLLRWCAE